VHQRHHDRVASALAEHELWDADDADWEDRELDPTVSGERGSYRALRVEVAQRIVQLPRELQADLGRDLAYDYREAVGKDVRDGKQVARVTRKRSFEEWADELGIPTNDTVVGNWRTLVVEAVQALPVRGQVG
jgi:hypothetical protein